MEAMGADLFATKGLEYVLVIGYLLLLVACRGMVGPRRSRSDLPEQAPSPLDALSIQLREGLHYHQGHTWAVSNGNGLMRVGIDDFAQQLLGPISGVILPRIGSEVGEGEPAWKMRMGRRAVPMLSPVEGEVVGWNTQILRSAELVNHEPYDGGWLLEIKVRNPAAALRNLLSGNLANAWLDDSVRRLDELFRSRPDREPEAADLPQEGLARLFSSDASDRLARDFLLSHGVGDWSPYADEPEVVVEKDREEEQLV